MIAYVQSILCFHKSDFIPLKPCCLGTQKEYIAGQKSQPTDTVLRAINCSTVLQILSLVGFFFWQYILISIKNYSLFEFVCYGLFLNKSVVARSLCFILYKIKKIFLQNWQFAQIFCHTLSKRHSNSSEKQGKK